MVVLLAGSSAFADFLVQPIIIKKDVHPGKRVPIEFKVENLSRDTTELVSLKLTDLSQNIHGIWKEVDPNDPNNTVDVSKLRSCKSWLTIDLESVTVDPYQVAPVHLMATIPPGTRGFYFAALVAETAPRQTVIDGPFGGALVGLRYIVPVVLQSQAGTPVQHAITVTDVGLEYYEATLERPTASVVAWMNVTNNGGTYSRLQGVLRVQQEVGGNWRRVADMKLSPCGIIPGVSLKLTQDVGTVLPSGKYRVEGYLYVDGRRGSGYSNEFDFVGDRRIVDPRTIAPIDLDKENLFIDVVHGASRGGSIQVTNVCEDPVTVNLEFMLPAHMRNLVNGRNIKGDDLGCADWVRLMPEEFLLPRYSRRNVNVNVKVPATATDYSNYYGTLRIHTTYADGSSAGMKTVNVCLTNTKATATPQIDTELFTLSQSITPGRYIATSTFANGGVTYCDPRCRGIVTGDAGAKVAQFLMESSGQASVFLPFEKRTFSGVLDVAEIPVGFYRLTAALVKAEAQDQMISEEAQNQIIIEVYEEGGQKAARSVGWDRTPDGQTGRTLIKL
ncbi:MAG: hypothetical protein ABFD90_02810 [Phycisphaerales bacterium]